MPEKTKEKKNTAYFTKVFSQMDELLDSAVTQEEMVDTVKAILDTIKKMEGRINDSVAKTKDTSEFSTAALRSDLRALESRISSAIDETRTVGGQTLAQAIAELREEMSDVQAMIPELPDYSGDFAALEARIPTLPPEKLGEDYRNALEALPEGDKLAIEAIEGLRKELDALKRQRSTGGGGGAIIGRDIIKDYDLSPYLDGSTKTFNIPAVWNIISVDTSSFPHALRKTVDFQFTSQTITFTDEIDASTVLAQGQTVVLTIVSA